MQQFLLLNHCVYNDFYQYFLYLLPYTLSQQSLRACVRVCVLDSWKCHSDRRHPILQELHGYNQQHAKGMEQNMVLLTQQAVCTYIHTVIHNQLQTGSIYRIEVTYEACSKRDRTF